MTNRPIVYAGAIPLDTDVLYAQQQTMVALGALIQSTFGSGTFADGLVCTQTTVASLSVTVGQGWLASLTTVEPNAYGSIAADAVTPLMKMGINLAATQLGPMSAPGTSGQSVVYLVQAAFSEADTTPIVLPYYNSANPSVPYAGPGGLGATQNTRRIQSVTLQLKQGTAATTGSQATPAPDSGFTALWAITIANGATTVVNGNIAVVATAPFIPAKLGVGMVPGFSRRTVLTSGTTSFTVPAGVTKVFYRLWGGGGGGGGLNAGSPAAACGGGGGEYREGVATVTPGQIISCTVGAAGAAGNTSGGNGGTGGSSSFGSIATAAPGVAGLGSTSGVSTPGGPGGSGGSGGSLAWGGQAGTTGTLSASGTGGVGGGSFGFGITVTNIGGGNGQAGFFPGQGGCGAGGTGVFPGGAGGPGLIIVEY